ncbi:MAG TPA: hypothetical protein ENI07_06210 [Desulfobacterales bacterium]|nr:hypothetical protein [Desulfobacterales bacterium]
MPKMVIWKFLLDRPENVFGSIEIEMPVGSEILSCQEQGGSLWLWALLNPAHEIKSELRTFHIVGTGKIFDYQEGLFKFIDTVQQSPFVWHVFEGWADWSAEDLKSSIV